ncbi:hypothetical protein Droror1_Dr00015994 [Drosera rotundifolia]
MASRKRRCFGDCSSCVGERLELLRVAGNRLEGGGGVDGLVWRRDHGRGDVFFCCCLWVRGRSQFVMQGLVVDFLIDDCSSVSVIVFSSQAASVYNLFLPP